MNFHSILRATAASACLWIGTAAPQVTTESSEKPGEKSVETLIAELSNDKFRIREEASRKLWAMGEAVLPVLQKAAAGKDPEQAYRARDLIRKIQLYITPDTDPAVIELVERYGKATPNDKVALFDQMHKRRAWRQILKLYANETDPKLQVQLQRSVDGVAVIAARERLLADDPKGAREFLEMAPADAPGLLALADFHRNQGTLETELKRAKTLKGVHSDAWQMALHRAAGNVEAARDSATAAGETKIAATMSALLGDPLPWLRTNQVAGDGGEIHRPYTELAIKRWQGNAIRPVDLEPLMRSVNSRNRMERQNGMNSLFLLGETTLAETAYLKISNLAAFSYFETLERIPEALKALDLDPEKPDYPAWVKQRIKKLFENNAEEEHDFSIEARELVILANFLEHHGLHEEAEAAFLPPLATLAEKNPAVFNNFLTSLFGGQESLIGAPQLAKKAILAWAGDNNDRWEEVINTAFGGQDETRSIWDWTADLNPKASRIERLDGMLALCGLGTDPHLLRNKWLELAWKAIDEAPADNKQPLLEKMVFLINQNGDVESHLRLWDMLPVKTRDDIFWRTHILALSAADRWDAAAEFFVKQIDRITGLKQEPQPYIHACLAACLRKAGRAEEAAAQDVMVEKLALGNDAIQIANGYAYGDDYKRASDWWARAVRQSDPGSDSFAAALQLYCDMQLDQGKWKEAASLSEVIAQITASADSGSSSPLVALRLRLQSDLGRALGNLKNDRAGSIAILENCHRMFPSDGSLADYFFPAIRKMGLIKEHDEWFKISWDRMSAVIAQFPNSDNTCNTAGWLASRAQRNLDQAEALQKKALAINPDQPAYLDTLAEVYFAKGQREKALEWSNRAVNFKPDDPQIRRQLLRFRTAPLPK
jgi:tetratricopeptide (TPR) repeat protein